MIWIDPYFFHTRIVIPICKKDKIVRIKFEKQISHI